MLARLATNNLSRGILIHCSKSKFLAMIDFVRIEWRSCACHGNLLAMSELENRESTVASVGQVVVILGLLLVYGMGGYWFAIEVVHDEESPMWLKLGIPAIVVGVTGMLLSVILHRMKAAKTDKYTDIHD